jgi:glutamyl-tRNA(Gln) amidotransferase subunit D
MTEPSIGGFELEGEDTVSLDGSGYHGLVLEKLSASSSRVGDTIKVISNGKEFTGILMPRSQIGSDPDHVVIKLENGYNVGVRLDSDCQVEKLKGAKKQKSTHAEPPTSRPDLPSVSILSTGGTIASRVDYRTGAVNPALSAQDLYDAVPELENHANIKAKIVMSVLSENIQPADWTKIVRSVAAEIKSGADGIVIAHGTDTLGFTAAALSFAIQNLSIPIALVGSQRSSDRPSSDAAVNLIGATDLVSRVDAAEVMVVMHGETDDSFVYAHRGTRVRKSHTSRRDAFQSVNAYPLYRLNMDEIHEITSPILRRDKERTPKVKPNFEEKVVLIKTYPGISGGIIDYLVKTNYKGIVIEGTGLGHAPELIHPELKRAIDADVVVAMTSQCVRGRIDMNVYRPGVELLDMGVIPCEDMLAETALVKMMWLLANTSNTTKVKEQMSTPLVGEIDMRSEQAEYTPQEEVA